MILKKYFALILLILISSIRFLTYCKWNIGVCYELQKERYDSEETVSSNKVVSTFQKIILSIRNKSTELSRTYLPSPHSELLLGMTIGLDELSKTPQFKDALRNTGTIHVVVVSGFNISLVSGLIYQYLGSKYKLKNIILAFTFTFLYAVLAGFEAPVVRAWIMGNTLTLGQYYGRAVNALQVLLFSALVMIICDPKYVFSLSFQLSFFATASLIMYTNIITYLIKSKNIILEGLCTTLAAQILVWPIISYNFGTVSLLSPAANAFILWVVSISTIVGCAFLFLGFISNYFAFVISLFLYPLLDYFVQGVHFFDKHFSLVLPYKMNTYSYIGYYLFAFAFYKFCKNKVEK